MSNKIGFRKPIVVPSPLEVWATAVAVVLSSSENQVAERRLTLPIISGPLAAFRIAQI